MAAAVSGGLEVGGKARLGGCEIAQGEVEVRRLEKPCDEVTTAEPAPDPRGAATREEDVPPRVMKLLRDLAPGLSAAHDQDLAGRERVRVPVALRVDDVQAARQRLGGRRTMSFLVRACRDHDRLCTQLAL